MSTNELPVAAWLHYPPKKPQLACVIFRNNATRPERGNGYITEPLTTLTAASAEIAALRATAAVLEADAKRYRRVRICWQWSINPNRAATPEEVDNYVDTMAMPSEPDALA